MEPYIQISFINDFLFCPRSIYFHQLYGNVSQRFYHTAAQARGKAAHSTVDSKTYTTAKTVLQGLEVYSDEYKICGKIDIFDVHKKLLTERKKQIRHIYDGYIFQIYAHYFCLVEMGYTVEHLKLYSMDDNKSYPVESPEDAPEKKRSFVKLINDIKAFNLDSEFTPNINKCQKCIYRNLCDYSLHSDI